MVKLSYAMEKLMSVEKQFCTRCTGLHYCMKIGQDYYCEWCFATMNKCPETRTMFAQMCEYYGIYKID